VPDRDGFTSPKRKIKPGTHAVPTRDLLKEHAEGRILFQDELVKDVQDLVKFPGYRHLCITGESACGQSIAAGMLARYKAGLTLTPDVDAKKLLLHSHMYAQEIPLSRYEAETLGVEDLTVYKPKAGYPALDLRSETLDPSLVRKPLLLKVRGDELVCSTVKESLQFLTELYSDTEHGVLYISELGRLLLSDQADAVLGVLTKLMDARDNRASHPVVVLAGDREAIGRLHAMSPNLFMRFKHSRVYPFTSEQIATVTKGQLLKIGRVPDPSFEKEAAKTIVNIRPVGDLVNARLAQALASSAALKAAQKGLKAVTGSDLDVSALRVIQIGGREGVEELESLIGLKDVKRTVGLWIRNSQLVGRRERLGLNTGGMGQHMVFKGPPGTAKTTVARIVGKILAETGVLSSGHMVEVHRADLVGHDAEQTNRQVVELVKRAMGGVLFIDEAYSLMPSDVSAYDPGKEIIDTLVKIMEDYRDEFVLIVAGYVVEMNQFLGSNPGLKSRFMYELEFPKYSVEELLEILDFIANSRGFNVASEVHEALEPYLKLQINIPGFGNGRHVRNLVESAISTQALRVELDATDEELVTLTLEDFKEAQVQSQMFGV